MMQINNKNEGCKEIHSRKRLDNISLLRSYFFECGFGQNAGFDVLHSDGLYIKYIKYDSPTGSSKLLFI